jgi:hypothetical protein
MAEYAKFRWTTAKVGASMALLALVAGMADKARAATEHASAKPATSGLFLKLSGLGGVISSDFLKVEKKMVKLTKSVSSLDAKLIKMNRTLTAVGKTYLKIADANAKFLKADGTAVNAQKLGGLAPSQFFQGSGSVVSGVLGNLTGTSQQLLSLPGGIIVVSVADTPGAGSTITIHNATGSVQAIASDIPKAPTVLQTGDTALPAVQSSGGDFHLQIFPGPGLPGVVSILIGLTPNPTNNQQIEAVAQAFTGGV